MNPLLKELIYEGAVEERSASFSLAMEKAKEKLKRFQLPDPRFYILQLIQAFIASGADRIEGTLKEEMVGATLTLRFNGPGYTRFELETLYDFLFSSGRDRSQDRTRELALGVVSCQALNPKEIRLYSNGSLWEKSQANDYVEQVINQDRGSDSFFEIVSRGRCPEVRLLKSHCLNCRVELTLNGDAVCSNSTLYMGTPWPNHRFQKDGMVGAVGLGYGELSQSSVVFLRYGVQVARRWEPRIHPPVALIVEAEEVRKNASQSDVVEDEAYFRCINSLQDVLMSLAAELASRRIPAYQRETVLAYLLEFFDEWISPRALEDPESLPESLRKLLSLRVFPDIKGRLHSLDQLKSYYHRDGYLSFAKKKMPYVKLGEWAVMCPSPRQATTLRRLFPQVRYVDDELVRSIREGRPARPVRDDQVKTRQHRTFLTQVTLKIEGHQIFTGVVDQHPSNRCTIVTLTSPSTQQEIEFRGWSVFVEQPSQVTDPVTTGLKAIAQAGPMLAKNLSLNLAQRAELQRFRARENLAYYLLNQLLGLDELSLTENFEVRVARAQEVVGWELWQVPLFETRQRKQLVLISLADLARWIREFGSATVAFGGPRPEDDFALDASSGVHRLLERIFGEDEIVEASFEDPRMPERRHQSQLAGASRAAELTPMEAEKTAEQEQAELDQLKAEFHQALEEPEQAQDSQEPAPLPEVKPIPTFGETEESKAPSPEPEKKKPEPKKISPKERERALLRATPCLVGRPFKRESLSGYVCIPRTGPNEISLYHGEEKIDTFDPGAVRAVGFAELEAPELGPQERECLEAECDTLYQLLAEYLQELEPHQPEFHRGQGYLLRYVLACRDKVLRQLELGGHSPLTRVHFIPCTGGSLASLDCFYQIVKSIGRVRVAEAGAEKIEADSVVAELGGLLTEDFFEQLFECRVDLLEEPDEDPPEERLLKALRREFVRLCSDPELALRPEVLAGLQWGEPTWFLQIRGRYYIQHHPDTGVTELNPNHGLVKTALKKLARDSRLVPVLVSSLYTTINKTLEEVEDHHELAFLEALLDAFPNG